METKTSKTTWIKNCFKPASRDNPVFASALSVAKKLSSSADKKNHQDVRSEATQLNQIIQPDEVWMHPLQFGQLSGQLTNIKFPSFVLEHEFNFLVTPNKFTVHWGGLKSLRCNLNLFKLCRCHQHSRKLFKLCWITKFSKITKLLWKQQKSWVIFQVIFSLNNLKCSGRNFSLEKDTKRDIYSTITLIVLHET